MLSISTTSKIDIKKCEPFFAFTGSPEWKPAKCTKDSHKVWSMLVHLWIALTNYYREHRLFPIRNCFPDFFFERETIANAVYMSLCRLPARGLHKQFILFSCYCLLVVSCIVLIQYLLRLQRYCFFGICANKRVYSFCMLLYVGYIGCLALLLHLPLFAMSIYVGLVG